MLLICGAGHKSARRGSGIPSVWAEEGPRLVTARETGRSRGDSQRWWRGRPRSHNRKEESELAAKPVAVVVNLSGDQGSETLLEVM